LRIIFPQAENAFKIRLVKEWLKLSDGPESAIEELDDDKGIRREAEMWMD